MVYVRTKTHPCLVNAPICPYRIRHLVLHWYIPHFVLSHLTGEVIEPMCNFFIVRSSPK